MNKYLQLAIEEARAAQTSGDYPYGAVLVRGGEIIGIGRNQMNTHNDPTSHAEIEVLRAAGLQENYADTVMYASAFPCIMCAGPIVMLGVPELVVGASWAGCEPGFTFQEHIPLNPDELTSSTILAPEAALGCSRGRLDSDSRATIRLRLPPAPATLRFPVLALAAVAYAVPPLRILQVSQPLRIAVDR